MAKRKLASLSDASAWPTTSSDFFARAVEVADEAEQLPAYDIAHLNEQINEKGYAVTALH